MNNKSGTQPCCCGSTDHEAGRRGTPPGDFSVWCPVFMQQRAVEYGNEVQKRARLKVSLLGNLMDRAKLLNKGE